MAQKNKVQAKVRASKGANGAANKTVGKGAGALKPAVRATAPAKKPVAKGVQPSKTVVAAKPVAKVVSLKKAAAQPAVKKSAAQPAAVSKSAVAAKTPMNGAKPQTIKVPLAVGAKAATKAAVAPQKPAMLVQAAPSVQPRAVPAAFAKIAGQKITAPVAAQPATPKAIATKAAAARQAMVAQKKPVNQRHGFKTNEFIVYPAHGVGRIIGIEEQEIAGMALELFVINFDKEKLTLRVPTGKLQSVGMRKLADDGIVKKAMEILRGRARVKRTMWSRRAQEYVAKINSGDLVSIAEVVRDLYRSEAQPEQSYSERQLYEDALDRMAREIAAVEKLDERGAVQRITDVLSKSARGRRLAEAGEGAEIKAA
jgi:CarD family transcriptional regulator